MFSFMSFLMVWSLKCLNYVFGTPEFLVNVSNIKVDIFSYNNKRRKLCRGWGGGVVKFHDEFVQKKQRS